MKAPTYPERVKEIVEAVGGLSELARQVNAVLPKGESVTYQTFQHLARTEPPIEKTTGRPKKGWKPAQGSAYDAAMALVSSYSPFWISMGRGERRAPIGTSAAPQGEEETIGARLAMKGFSPEDLVEAIGVPYDEAEAILRGNVVPSDKDQLRKLSKLVGMPVAQLANPASGGPLADAEKMSVVRLNPDERGIIDIYRKLKPFGKHALRNRVVELQQEFLPKDKTNPFGKKQTSS